MNPYKLTSIDSLKYMQAAYFSTGSNNAASYSQKLELINLICFLTQKLNQKDAKKYPSCLSVLETIFNINLNNNNENLSPQSQQIRSFGMLCDDLLWGTNDEIAKPEGITNAKEIKDKIITYFNEEWTPF